MVYIYDVYMEYIYIYTKKEKKKTRKRKKRVLKAKHIFIHTKFINNLLIFFFYNFRNFFLLCFFI